MALNNPALVSYAAGIRSHHERMNGSGYPDGLVGEEIPLESRIVSVADVFNAMTSERCYSASLLPQQAFRELTSGSGRLYDADVVDAMLSLFDVQTEYLSVA